ncbi:unnamed protein product [Rotaria sp. Silwood1]|nr:unnamed protein product [Rotaria sp. Silwood1]
MIELLIDDDRDEKREENRTMIHDLCGKLALQIDPIGFFAASNEFILNSLSTVRYAEFCLPSCHNGYETIHMDKRLVPFTSTYMPHLQTLRLWRPDDFPWTTVRPDYKRYYDDLLPLQWLNSLEVPESIAQHVIVFEQDLCQLIDKLKDLTFLDIYGKTHYKKVEPYRLMVQARFPDSRPWQFDENRPDIKPIPIKDSSTYYDCWDEDHVRMPCSKHYAYVYSNDNRARFMYDTLPKICNLALNLKLVCTQSPPLLKIGTNRSVTMSQEQAAALLACAFFCLFPYRTYPSAKKEYEHFQDPNFETLYRDVRQNKLEKLKCILHYFNRVTEHMPNGVITFQRVSLPKHRFPSWHELNTGLCDLNMTTGKKIEDIKNVLQVDFANKYIGGGVLGGGCVQEEIRFTICPEMLVSLLVCEVMDNNECIFLIGCERYSSYKGYADSFEYAGDYQDNTPRDGWDRKWCHVIAMDAVYFRNPSDQYNMKVVERELLKAYTGFRPIGDGADYKFGIATGNWGCGAFNSDKQLKENIVELLDLPDEMILSIMNKIKPRPILLYSMIGIKNIRLEQLALGQCHSIDLTSDYFESPNEMLIQKFISFTLPCIFNYIESLTINILHIRNFDRIAKTIHDKNCLNNLKHLKIMAGRFHCDTQVPFRTNYYDVIEVRRYPLFSDIPQVFDICGELIDLLVSFYHHSPIMSSIISFEFGPNCVASIPPSDELLSFPQSHNLTHICITFRQFDDCVRLLNQIGAQLHSFDVSIMRVRLSRGFDLSEISLICCPNLKELKMRIYRNIFEYEQCIIPLLQRLSNVEHLTLLLAIDVNEDGPNHFIDGFDLQRDIVSYMPKLFQFDFHIRSILKNANHIELDKIRQSFIQYKQSIDCTIDYFNNQYSQCQIYSLPYIGTRLDFISNRFPLFNVEKRFSNVTMLILFDDIKPFEHVFFQRVARVLPRLKLLEVFNLLEQEEKNQATNNSIEFRHLSTLILHDIHADYVQQLLYRTYLPCLIELVIRNDFALTIINQNQQQVKNNCSKVQTLITVEPWTYPNDTYQKFFPNLVVFHKRMLNNKLFVK